MMNFFYRLSTLIIKNCAIMYIINSDIYPIIAYLLALNKTISHMATESKEGFIMDMYQHTLITPKELGNTIRRLRITQKLSQAAICTNFIAVRTLQKIEKGDVIPTFEVLLHIANNLNIDLFDLILASRIPKHLDPKFAFVMELLNIPLTFSHQRQVEESEAMLESLASLKLPYTQSFRISIAKALIAGLVHNKTAEALTILRENRSRLHLDGSNTFDETKLFFIVAYLRFENDVTQFQTFFQLLQNYPLYFFHPATAYAANLFFYQQELWHLMETTAYTILKQMNLNSSLTLIPSLYCQLGIARHKRAKSNATHYFETGLELLILLRQKETFHMMITQAQLNQLPISGTRYYDILTKE